MKYFKFIGGSLAALLLIVLYSCTNVEFNNVLDPQYEGYIGDEAAADGENGIARGLDPDDPVFGDTIPPEIIFYKMVDGQRVETESDTITIDQFDEEALHLVMNDLFEGKDNWPPYDLTDSVQISGQQVNVNIPGTYRLRFSVSDSRHPAVNRDRFVVVEEVDIPSDNPPSLHVNADDTITFYVDSEFRMPEVTAWDDDGTLEVEHEDNIDMSTEGVYYITFWAENEFGREEATVYVRVQQRSGQNTDPPTITLDGPSELTLDVGSAFVEPGYSAEDNMGNDITDQVTIRYRRPDVQTVDELDTDIPGVWRVMYNVRDSDGRSASANRTLTIQSDGEPPELTLLGEAEMEWPQGEPFVDPGYEYDDSDPNVTVSVTGRTGGWIHEAGRTQEIIYTAIDASTGHYTERKRLVTVVGDNDNGNGGGNGDVGEPTIELLGDDPLTIDQFTNFDDVDPGATAEDYEGNSLTVSVGGDLDTRTPGEYEVIYTAEDSHGNTVQVTRTVIVEEVDGDALFAKYGVPRDGALPAIGGQYTSITVEGDGVNFSNVQSFTFDWDGVGLYGFAINTTDGNPDWYIALHNSANFSYSFSSAQPSFTIESSGFDGFDGEYYVNVHEGNLVFVHSTGAHAIVFE
ncbi:DUF5011 domain-containing protein [Chitinispirillales bacterium ANBcel5]|uniref:immunoglobulin-like domain-containing protein n=1 Tax=Cellulosispirillum alkaliphilum TaxID=3039283 RepID=UPI002A5638C0|nr:DUF5011 domain-containing protein [Chitinispirillales bacterium ANBcel5]